jgi:4-alpha-glucanotransferase
LAWRSRPEIEVWLKEAALFDAICKTPELLGKDWWDWPTELRTRDAAALDAKRASSTASIDEFCATQFLFDKQWLAIKKYANDKGVALVGDMPIYVGGHSADVWANQSLFLLNGECKPSAVAGVPPDAFSEDGQLWGNPLYDWPAHEAEGYRWWAGRLGRALELHDEVRIDHFRAFAAYYSVPADAKTAKTGSWMVGPGESFFKGIAKALGGAPIVAEDLGVITTDVVALREAIDAPGMVVLQFAWGDDERSPHCCTTTTRTRSATPARTTTRRARAGTRTRMRKPSSSSPTTRASPTPRAPRGASSAWACPPSARRACSPCRTSWVSATRRA